MPRRFSVSGCLVLYGILFRAAAGGQVTCTVTSTTPPYVRNQGLTELTADLLLECMASRATPAMTVHFQLFVNTNLTSRLFGPTRTEALLLIDDPANGRVGTDVFVSEPAAGRANSVVWANVPVAAFPAGGRRRFRIKNIRVDATPIGSAGLGLPGQVVAFLSINPPGAIPLNNPQQVLAFVQPALNFFIRNGADPSQPANPPFPTPPGLGPGAAPNAYLRFEERIKDVLRTRGTATQTAPGTPSSDYGTESGYTIGLAVGGQPAGLADLGTRLKASFATIPAGVHIWVGLLERNGRARLTASEAGVFSPVSSPVTAAGMEIAEVPLVNGAGSVVWEVLAADRAVIDTYDFPVFLATEGSVGSGAGTVMGELAPVSTVTTGSATAPIPRFAASGTPVPFVAPPTFTVTCSSTDGPARVGVFYSVECSAAHGTEPYVWGFQGGELPRGLSQSAVTGPSIRIEGTPSTPGPYSYRVEAADQSRQRASVPFSGVVQERIASEIPGSAGAIAVGPGGSVYIIGTAPCNEAGCPPYRWNGSAFERIDRDGSGIRIAVDSTETLWLVNKGSAICRYTSPTSDVSKQMPGGAMDIAAGGGSVYVLGIGECDAVGCLPYLWDGAEFRGMQGRGRRIAADSSGALWMVDNNKAIYRYRSATQGALSDRIPGGATAIAASADGAVYIVGTDPCDGNGCTVAKFNGTSFTPITGLTAVEIAADRNGVLWLITKRGQILRHPLGEPMRVSCVPSTGPATAGLPYSTTCAVSNGLPPFQWLIGGGVLPAGLSLNTAGVTATVTGTPSAAGPYRFTVTVRDSFNPPRTVEWTFSGSLAAPPTPVTLGCVPAGGPVNAGVAWSTTCTAAGGVAPYRWSTAAGNLPAGLALSATEGASISISGAPTGSGAYDFTLMVRDGIGASATQRFTGTIAPLTGLTVNCVPGVGPAVVGVACSETCTAAGGIPPYRWSISPGTLPPGLALSGNSGVTVSISGTPSASGNFAFTVSVTDSAIPPQTAAKSYSGTLSPQQFRTFNGASYREGTVAADSLASLFGTGLAPRTESCGGSVVTTLGGCTVRITDSRGVGRDARLFFASSGQVNFLVPAETAVGRAGIVVSKPGLDGVLVGSVLVADVAPGIFVAGGGSTVPAAFYLRVTASGERTQDYTFDPATLNAVTIPRLAGDRIYLLLYGTGFRHSRGVVTATANGEEVPVLAAVAQGEFAGLDQVNIGPLPASLGSGTVMVRLTFDGVAANEITVRLQ